jgi:hypothetical protein
MWISKWRGSIKNGRFHQWITHLWYGLMLCLWRVNRTGFFSRPSRWSLCGTVCPRIGMWTNKRSDVADRSGRKPTSLWGHHGLYHIAIDMKYLWPKMEYTVPPMFHFYRKIIWSLDSTYFLKWCLIVIYPLKTMIFDSFLYVYKAG